jgi:hypothetical protein
VLATGGPWLAQRIWNFQSKANSTMGTWIPRKDIFYYLYCGSTSFDTTVTKSSLRGTRLLFRFSALITISDVYLYPLGISNLHPSKTVTYAVFIPVLVLILVLTNDYFYSDEAAEVVNNYARENAERRKTDTVIDLLIVLLPISAFLGFIWMRHLQLL